MTNLTPPNPAPRPKPIPEAPPELTGLADALEALRSSRVDLSGFTLSDVATIQKRTFQGLSDVDAEAVATKLKEIASTEWKDAAEARKMLIAIVNTVGDVLEIAGDVALNAMSGGSYSIIKGALS